MSAGLVIAAPRSGSGKTVLTLGIVDALRRRMTVAVAKTGPDYIDPAFLSLAAGRPAINLDPWAMTPGRLKALAARAAGGVDLLVVEGVMGLFDGAADGSGSTADLASTLDLPVVLVVDATGQAQSVAALVSGFANWRRETRIAGVILNRVASARHATMLREALEETGTACLGTVPRDPLFAIPDRHLGLTLPREVPGFAKRMTEIADRLEHALNMDGLVALAQPVSASNHSQRLAPLGQRIAIARDAAFSFCYAHWIADWQSQGAELRFFSPLANESPPVDCDAVFLPGGYPELHAGALAAAGQFKRGLADAQSRGALIYGECGGFMVMGAGLTDTEGQRHEMAGLLPHETRFDAPKRHLGYRRLCHESPLPWPSELSGHEFHYSSGGESRLPSLFSASDARGAELPPMGARDGRVMGSYVHVIDVAPGTSGAP